MIAVVGGRGLIGAAIVDALRRAGRQVTVVTHDRAAAERPGHRYGDLLQPGSLTAAVDGAEVVIQSANFPTYPIEKPRRRHTFLEFDGLGTERLLAASREAGVRRYVFVSGCGVDPRPEKPYFEAIHRGEQALLASGLEAVSLRPAFVYGPRDRGLNRILGVARALRVLPVVGSGLQLHQPVYVNDVAEVARRAAEPGAPQGIFEIGGPERMTLNQMLRRTLAAAGVQAVIVHVPRPLAKLGAAVLQHFPGPPLTVAALHFISEDFVADLGPTQSAFPVRLTRLEDGLGSYVAAKRRARASLAAQR